MKRYRQNAHAVPLIVWAFLCAVTAWFLFHHSGTLLQRTATLTEIAAGVALLVLGPLSLVAYLLRARLAWVSVSPEGIEVGKRGRIPWSKIERIERQRPRLRRSSGPAEMNDVGKSVGIVVDSISGFDGCLVSIGEGILMVVFVVLLFLAAVVALWLIFFVILPLLIVPLLEIFIPIGDRIRIVLRSGKPVLLRDLREADAFVNEIRSKVEVRE